MNDQDFTTQAKDQKRCSSCLFFGIVGALESLIEIKEGLPDLDPDLSEQYLMSCVFMKNILSFYQWYKNKSQLTFFIFLSQY